MAGFFAGPAANRAGLVYDVSTHSVTPASCPTSPCAATSIKGTAAFVKN
jgi:hypothetical protein